MTGTVFYKMSGSGNDFVFLDGRWTGPDEWPVERIQRVCARSTGVGADGLVILSPGSGPGAVRFLFYNNDGSRVAMCGNAALCATRLSALLELAPPDGVELETDAGLVRSRCLPGMEERAELLLPDVQEPQSPDIEPEAGETLIRFALVGVPHLVVRVVDLEATDVVGRGRALRRHPALAPQGANINFVAGTDDKWAMRTYERGVEAETLACGTGAVACATALGAVGDARLPWQVLTRTGTVLSVEGDLRPGGALARPRLAGPARLAYRGVLGQGL